ncbi:guanyl-nucleotide exchange factor [Lithospermum erythrorhizon]|uniref:Guanyl-nucleotide exchange factor n=1 Tax=Lithospermum erythrorhizon TaxID=34254 RepID=A0AAV3REV1_LITER
MKLLQFGNSDWEFRIVEIGQLIGTISIIGCAVGEEVVLGGEGVRRYPRPEKEYRSFSLIYNDRSLDLICKDKDKAEVWFSGLKSLIFRSHQRKWRTESRNDGISSGANNPRTYTRRSSPVNSPFGSGDNLHKFIGATMGMAELNIQNENGHIAMPWRYKLAFKVVVQLALDIARGPEGHNLPYPVHSINALSIYLHYILNGYELVYQGEGDIDNLIHIISEKGGLFSYSLDSWRDYIFANFIHKAPNFNLELYRHGHVEIFGWRKFRHATDCHSHLMLNSFHLQSNVHTTYTEHRAHRNPTWVMASTSENRGTHFRAMWKLKVP